MGKAARLRAVTAPVEPLPSQITEPELVLLRQLHADVQLAQGVLQRYTNGLIQRYQLGPQDTLNLQGGVITRLGPKPTEPV